MIFVIRGMRKKSSDRLEGKVTIGEIKEVHFILESGKVARAWPDGYGAWGQGGNFLIDPDVLDATFNALKDQGYVSHD